MVTQCANPSCGTPFYYFRGKLFAVARRQSPDSMATTEYFWLCATCSPHLDLIFDVQGDSHLVDCEPSAGISKELQRRHV